MDLVNSKKANPSDNIIFTLRTFVLGPAFAGHQLALALGYRNLGEIPQEIKNNYSKLPLYHEDHNHIYVHAGLNPSVMGWKSQPEHDFMYIKDEFIQHTFENLNKKVIFGHTRTMDIHGT